MLLFIPNMFSSRQDVLVIFLEPSYFVVIVPTYFQLVVCNSVFSFSLGMGGFNNALLHVYHGCGLLAATEHTVSLRKIRIPAIF